MSNFTPLLLFGVNVELSSLLNVSFNIDLMCGPWSIGHVFSHEMVRLSNLDRARDLVQPGTSCHDFALNLCENKSTIIRLMTRYRDTGDVMTRYRETGNVKDRAKSDRPRKTQQTDHIISGIPYPLPAADGPQRGVPT